MGFHTIWSIEPSLLAENRQQSHCFQCPTSVIRLHYYRISFFYAIFAINDLVCSWCYSTDGILWFMYGNKNILYFPFSVLNSMIFMYSLDFEKGWSNSSRKERTNLFYISNFISSHGIKQIISESTNFYSTQVKINYTDKILSRWIHYFTYFLKRKMTYLHMKGTKW